MEDIKKFGKGRWESSHFISEKLTGSYSKIGRARVGLIQELPDIWCCQSCGTQHTKEEKPLIYEYPEHEYIRVCAECFNNGCRAFRIRMKEEFALEVAVEL